MLEPMSRTPSRMAQRYSPSRHPRTLARCPRGRPGVSACVRRVRRPRRPRPGLQVRPDLADVELHVHLRPGLPGHLQGVARHRLLHARRPLRRQGRREAGRDVRRPAHARAVAAAARTARRSAARTGSRPTTTAPARPRWSRSTASRRASSTTAATSPSEPAAPCTHWRCSRAGTRSRPSPTCAGSCRSAVRSAPSSGRTTRRTRRSRSASTTAVAGVRAATTSTGTAPATPRRTSRVEPVYVTNAPELTELMGEAGVRRARAALRGPPALAVGARAASRRPALTSR